MEVTTLTSIIAIGGLVLIGLLASLQLVAVISPHNAWTVKYVYGGDPNATDPIAYFAFNQAYAWADVLFLAPLQIAGSVGMLLGERWGFLLAFAASVPFWYSAVNFFIWDRDLHFRGSGAGYWVFTWGMWPVFGIVAGIYCFVRLLE